MGVDRAVFRARYGTASAVEAELPTLVVSAVNHPSLDDSASGACARHVAAVWHPGADALRVRTGRVPATRWTLC